MADTEPPFRAPPPGDPFGSVGRGMQLIVRQTFAILGLTFIAISIPLGLLTPFIPIGLPIAIIGVILLGRSTKWGQRLMEGILTRYPSLERLAPNWLMKSVFGREKRKRL